MLIENKSSSYPETYTSKREICAPYNPLPSMVPDEGQVCLIGDDKNLNNYISGTNRLNHFFGI
jgi:hypothetical protein